MTSNKQDCCGSNCCDSHEEHDQACGCGCGCDHEHEENMIYLTTEEGEEMACAVLGIFEVENEEYIALLPENTETAFIYGFKEDGEEIELIRIEDEAHYQKVSDIFMEIWTEEGEEEA